MCAALQVKKKEGKRHPELEHPPALEDEVETSSGEDIPMYFSKPQQLLEIFTQLEESNLFLIQNCQDIEQHFEELKQQYRDTERAMSKQSQALEVRLTLSVAGSGCCCGYRCRCSSSTLFVCVWSTRTHCFLCFFSHGPGGHSKPEPTNRA